MYIFKFIKWFFCAYLTVAADRYMAGLAIWTVLLVPTFIVAIALNMPAIIGYFLAVSASLATFTAIIVGFLYMRRRYFEWQRLVVEKLKGN